MAPISAYVSPPQSAMTPPAIQASSSSASDGSVAAIDPGVRKIADPMTLVMTSSVALRRPMPRISLASGSVSAVSKSGAAYRIDRAGVMVA